MFDIFRRKLLRSILLVTRTLSRRACHKNRFAFKLYYWSDRHLNYSVGRIYIIPGVVYRSMTAILNYGIYKNVISINPVRVRSQRIGELMDTLIHKIPDKFRYPKMPAMTTPAIGQDGKDHCTQNAINEEVNHVMS